MKGNVEIRMMANGWSADTPRYMILRADEADKHPRRNELLRALGANEHDWPGLPGSGLRDGAGTESKSEKKK